MKVQANFAKWVAFNNPQKVWTKKEFIKYFNILTLHQWTSNLILLYLETSLHHIQEIRNHANIPQSQDHHEAFNNELALILEVYDYNNFISLFSDFEESPLLYSYLDIYSYFYWFPPYKWEKWAFYRLQNYMNGQDWFWESMAQIVTTMHNRPKERQWRHVSQCDKLEMESLEHVPHGRPLWLLVCCRFIELGWVMWLAVIGLVTCTCHLSKLQTGLIFNVFTLLEILSQILSFFLE